MKHTFNPIKGFKYKAKGMNFVIQERWNSGNLTVMDADTGTKYFTTVEKWQEAYREGKIEV